MAMLTPHFEGTAGLLICGYVTPESMARVLGWVTHRILVVVLIVLWTIVWTMLMTPQA